MDLYNRKPPRVNMEFVSPEEQYAEIDLTLPTKIVQAEYVQDVLEPDNPLICALPRPRKPEEMINTKEIVKIPYEVLIKQPYDVQLGYLAKLRDLHYVLPMQIMTEDALYYSLRLSYTHRKYLTSKISSIEYTVANEKEISNRKLIGYSDEAAFPGFELIGKSGSGKSTCIREILSRIPQILIHTDEKGQTFPQIVYLVVNSPGNSNFRALFERIGHAIDKAAGNTDMCYERIFKDKKKTIGQLINDLIKLVEELSIGIIILDEIQNLSKYTGIENSLGNLFQTGNETKMVFGVVGTRYSEEFVLNQIDEFQGRRRLGIHISADSYCSDRQFFQGMVEWLFQFQLFNPRINPTKNIVDALYECTSGIIDCLISLFTYISMEYIIKASYNIYTEINEEFIHNVADKYFKSLLTFIKKNILVPDEEDDLRILLELATKSIQAASIKQAQFVLANGRRDSTANLIEDATDSLHALWCNHFNRDTVHTKVAAEAKKLEKKGDVDITELMVGVNEKLINAKKTDARKIPFGQGKSKIPAGDGDIHVNF